MNESNQPKKSQKFLIEEPQKSGTWFEVNIGAKGEGFCYITVRDRTRDGVIERAKRVVEALEKSYRPIQSLRVVRE